MIDNSYLLGLYGITSSGVTTTASSGASAAAKKQPTPPWDSKAVAPEQDVLVRAALGGRKVINENNAQLDMAGASADYRKLFALYQGLETLNALVNRASTKGVPASEKSLLDKRFIAGLSEISGYVSSAGFEDVRVVQGVSSAISKSTAAVPRDSAKSVTAAVHEGSLGDEVDAFKGEVVFNISLKRVNDTVDVPIDLANMGDKPRTLGNVISYINDQLELAGVETRVGHEQIKAEPRTMTVGGKTVTLPAGADKWALVVRGSIGEKVTFSAPETADGVYVVQSSGTAGAHQMLKFQTDLGGSPPEAIGSVGQTYRVEGSAGQYSLPEGVTTVRASATAPDGSIWLVADMDQGVDNQPIKGQSDVVLMKFDSAGRMIASRALGAASNASGYALAVDADGRVAVAGSVTGALIPGDSGAVSTGVDSFVTVYDADGVEQWTQRRGAREADEATSVQFGEDGMVYVAGRARSAMTGGYASGGWDGYVQAFEESQLHKYAPITAKPVGVTQFGTAADDSVQAMVVEGSSLYTAGVEDGQLIVRQFTLTPGAEPELTAVRDLGRASGSVAGLNILDGKVVLTGTTRNEALDIGTVNREHSGGTDAYIAVLDGDLAPSSEDRLTYIGGEGDDTAADIKLHEGKIWITGVSNRPEGAKATDPTEAYLSRIDPLSGAVEWTRTWQGDAQQASPLTLAVSSGSASVLDRLGLPQGEIVQSDSKRLIDATSLRAGDQFKISPAGGGRAITITIEERDTLQTLARKIEAASNKKLKVTVASEGGYVTGKDGETTTTAGGFQRLSIMAADGKTGAVISAGPSGRDALAGLGLSPGYVGSNGSGKDEVKTFGMNLAASLNLSTAEGIKAAGDAVQEAMKAVRDAYRALAPQSTTPAVTGKAPAYLTAQLANYQAALARLTGG